MNPSIPNDTQLIEWADREDFGRVRAEWLQLHRWDTKLSPATVTALAEIAGRMAHDKNFAWPSIQRLAAELGWSEPTVKRAIAQAIQRGWIICEKRGFGASNHYAMSASTSVTAEVITRHDQRVAALAEGRLVSMRSKMIPMEASPNEINFDPSMRSKMIHHSDQKRSLNEINFDPLTLSKNLIKEPDHRTLYQGLSDETVQDESLGGAAIDFGDVYRALGKGDEELGASRVIALGKRWPDLRNQIEAHGIGGAWEQIQDAIALAIAIESKSKTEVTP